MTHGIEVITKEGALGLFEPNVLKEGDILTMNYHSPMRGLIRRSELVIDTENHPYHFATATQDEKGHVKERIYEYNGDEILLYEKDPEDIKMRTTQLKEAKIWREL